MFVSLLLIVASGTAVASPLQTQDKTLDATLSDSAGNSKKISEFRGKPTVVFYEDRGSRELNRKLKDELWKQSRERGLTGTANVVGVVNLQAFDFWPARGFARDAIEDVEKRVGVKVLIDWTGALAQAPWNLPPTSSTVVLLDSDGTVRHSHSGAMNDVQMAELFEKLSSLLALPK